jgi:hypothetical protein
MYHFDLEWTIHLLQNAEATWKLQKFTRAASPF